MEKRPWPREYFEALLIAGIFLGFSNTFLIKTFYIPSGSMKETLLVGDHLFVNRFLYGNSISGLEQKLLPTRDVRRGDIVIFRSPEDPATDLVKRCIGLPGDEILITEKVLHINGQEVDDSAYAVRGDPRVFKNRSFYTREQRMRDNFGPFVVPEDHFFFLGDNRDYSYDSRFWRTSAVPRHFLKGRALMIYWSFGGETSDGSWRGWKNKARLLMQTVTGFFTKTRWERTFKLVR